VKTREVYRLNYKVIWAEREIPGRGLKFCIFAGIAVSYNWVYEIYVSFMANRTGEKGIHFSHYYLMSKNPH